MKKHITLIGSISLLASCATEPLSYTVHDTLRNQSAGARPFFVDSLTGVCSETEGDERQCRQGIQNALRNAGYRVISSDRSVEDYNTVACDLQTNIRTESREVQTVDLFGSISQKNLQTNPDIQTGLAMLATLSCEIEDGLTYTSIYSGTGQSQVFIQDEGEAIRYFTQAVERSATQAFGRLGPAALGDENGVITVEAIGFDDGVRESHENDLSQAIRAAKVVAAERAGSRYRDDETNTERFRETGRGDASYQGQYSRDVRNITDANIISFDIVEDFGYVDGRYKVKIRATLTPN